MASSTWVLDPSHSEVNFKIKHLMITNVSGSFEKFDVKATTDEDDFNNAKIAFTAETASVTTNNEQRDQHLKGADFFDAETFPTISFNATGYEKVDNDGSFSLIGDLTIKGITKQIRAGVEFGGTQKDPWGNLKAGFTINGKINRTDFGLIWNSALETGGVLVSEDVKFTCEIQLMKHVETKID